MSESIPISNTVVKSELFGEIILDLSQVYQFNEGIVGFSHLKQFVLLPFEGTELFILQSLSEEISLLLVPAQLVANNASFHIDDITVQQLDVEREEQIALFYILRFIDEKPFINLKAPILIVPEKNTGCQYVNNDDNLSIRAPLVLVGESPC